jgi:hypothetical protein
MPRMAEIETFNEFMVAVPAAGGISLIRPPQAGERLTKERALRLAAWLVALADGPAEDEDPNYQRPAHGRTRFTEILEAVEAT